MTDIRRTDPAARRRVAIILIIGTLAGALLIAGFEQYRIPLRDWILSDPQALEQRIRLVFLLLAVVLIAPLLAFATCLWSLGQKTLRTREFPPPGLRVIRDSPVITGEKAIYRGRLLKILALGCSIASVTLVFLLWRLASSVEQCGLP